MTRNLLLCLILVIVLPVGALAHNVSKRDATFVQSNTGAAIAPFLSESTRNTLANAETAQERHAYLLASPEFNYR